MVDRGKRADGLLTTGDMARLTGNTLRTVRFYEEAAILRPDRRSAGGHRLFSGRELERLQFITDMRAAGLSLDEIRSLLDLRVSAENGRTAAVAALEALDVQVDELQKKIEVFERLKDDLKRAREVLRECERSADNECFPSRCSGCDVLLKRGDLPPSIRVLWAPGGDELE